jgi:prepilin-type N-terminal cleavage/methylation domain-containing protein
MKKNKFNNAAGMTLIEIMIAVVISAIMMGALYTTYSAVNNSYSQVTDRAKISRSGRDIIAMLMRDIRLAGFKYHFGKNASGIPKEDNLQHAVGNGSIGDSHDPIIVVENELGYSAEDRVEKNNPENDINPGDDTCCDKIHIVYGDFNQNDSQPYKRYKVTYYAKPSGEGEYYAVYKSKKSWIQTGEDSTGSWVTDCAECFTGELIRDHLVDMEFIVFDNQGRIIDPPPRPDNASRKDLYNIAIVDVRLTFRSKSEFYRSDADPKKGKKPRLVKGLGDRTREFTDKYLRDSVVVSVHTRNIGS